MSNLFERVYTLNLADAQRQLARAKVRKDGTQAGWQRRIQDLTTKELERLTKVDC